MHGRARAATAGPRSLSTNPLLSTA
jgi:hypothetical protein